MISLRTPDAAGDPTPLYFKLEGILRAAIESREYPDGSALPTERALGDLYGVSRVTVRRALEALQRDGLVRRDRGRKGGTFVATRAEPAEESRLVGSFDVLFSTRRIRHIDILRFDLRPCPAGAARMLRMAADTEVRYVERVLSAPAGPVAHVRNYVPVAYGAELRRRDLRQTMLHQVLAERGVKVVEIDDEIGTHVADSRIAALLGMRPGGPLLSVERLFLGRGGQPVNLTLLLIRTDRYRMTVRLHDQVLE